MVDSRFYERSPIRRLITLMMVLVVCVGLVVSPRVPSAGAAECKGRLVMFSGKMAQISKTENLLVAMGRGRTFSSTGKLTQARKLAINSL